MLTSDKISIPGRGNGKASRRSKHTGSPSAHLLVTVLSVTSWSHPSFFKGLAPGSSLLSSIPSYLLMLLQHPGLPAPLNPFSLVTASALLINVFLWSYPRCVMSKNPSVPILELEASRFLTPTSFSTLFPLHLQLLQFFSPNRLYNPLTLLHCRCIPSSCPHSPPHPAWPPWSLVTIPMHRNPQELCSPFPPSYFLSKTPVLVKSSSLPTPC